MKNELLVLQSNAKSATLTHAASPLFLHLANATCQKGSRASEPKSGCRKIDLPKGFAVARARKIASDENSSQLVNFPFAFSIAVLLLAGMLGMCWGMIIPDVPTALGGFAATLIGSGLYGWSLADD